MEKTKRISELLTQIRDELRTAQGIFNDISHVSKVYAENKDHLYGFLTSGIVLLWHEIEDAKKFERADDDIKFGDSIPFRSRGIGLDSVPRCFVCGSEKRTIDNHHANQYMNNIAAFVDTKDDGEKVVSLFQADSAKLDYREYEKNWIQVKIGACDEHKGNLECLHRKTMWYGVIREHDIVESIVMK